MAAAQPGGHRRERSRRRPCRRDACLGVEFAPGHQPLAAPAGDLARVGEPVVQPMRARQPQLDPLGQQMHDAPVRRSRHGGALEAFPDAVERRHQRRARGNGLALRRGPRAQLALAIARREVRVGFADGRLRQSPLHAHLPIQHRPVEHQRAVRVLRQLAPLTTVVVGDQPDGTVLDPLVKDGANRRPPIARGGGQGEGVRHQPAALGGQRLPFHEHGQRIRSGRLIGLCPRLHGEVAADDSMPVTACREVEARFLAVAGARAQRRSGCGPYTTSAGGRRSSQTRPARSSNHST